MEKNTYIATFYAHFGAIRYKKELARQGIAGTLMPVPRKLSSSCGTCVRYEAETWLADGRREEIEQIVREEEDGYACVYRAENG